LFDVGANTGQYAANARREGYTGQTISFEPLREAHAALTKNAQKDEQWIVHDRVAIGSRIGEVEINVSKNSYSSSILPILDAHTIAAPQSAYEDVEKVPLKTLDSIFNQYFHVGQRAYLKIDTQGYESEVLSGAVRSFSDIFAVELELSTVHLYEGQKLYDYFFSFFSNRGFLLWTITPGFSNDATGQMLQFDAVFVRQS
jgi:FkbM family methyltransferase